MWCIGMLVQFPYGTDYQAGVIISSPKQYYMVGELVEVWVKGEIKKIRTKDLQLQPFTEKI
jgi:hypothetical protein